MTLKEFLSELEFRMFQVLDRRAADPKHSPVADGLVLVIIPSDHKSPIEGISWLLGTKVFRRELKISLSPKGHIAWKKGDFEALLPAAEAEDWIELDEEKQVVSIRLHVRGRKRDGGRAIEQR